MKDADKNQLHSEEGKQKEEYWDGKTLRGEKLKEAKDQIIRGMADRKDRRQ